MPESFALRPADEDGARLFTDEEMPRVRTLPLSGVAGVVRCGAEVEFPGGDGGKKTPRLPRPGFPVHPGPCPRHDPCRRLLNELDAVELAFWKAKYDIEGGFGEHKADRRTAFQIMHIQKDGKTTVAEYMEKINPALKKRKDSPKDRLERAKRSVAALGAMAKTKTVGKK